MTRSPQLSPAQPLASRRIQLEIEQNGRSGTATVRDASPRDLLITSQMVLAVETPLLFRMEAGGNSTFVAANFSSAATSSG